MERKIDKRTIQTKKNIKKVVSDLLLETEPSKLSVTNVSELCKINRNTFYIHYSSIDDVINDIEVDVVKQILDYVKKFDLIDYLITPRLLPNAISSSLLANEARTKIIFDSSISQRLISKINHSLVEYISICYQKEVNDADRCYFYSIEFLVAGFIYSFEDWYHSSHEVSLDTFLSRIYTLSENGVTLTFKNKIKK